MSILSREQIIQRLTASDNSRIVVTPLIAAEIGPASLDVRLGRHFVAFRKTRFLGVDVLGTLRARGTRGGIDLDIEVAKRVERIYVPIGDQFVLHPQQLVLACTLEYLVLPDDVGAYVLTRSSTGRLGILTATATFFHPGFRGVATLELINTGDTAVTMAPGMRVAQFVFEETRATSERPGRYQLTTRPEASRLSGDPDIAKLASLQPDDM